MELKGFVLDDDHSMHAVSFEIEDGVLFARRDGEIWDYSQDPNDFIKLIEDRVYTMWTREYDDKMTYDHIVSLSQWLVKGGVDLEKNWYPDEEE